MTNHIKLLIIILTSISLQATSIKDFIELDRCDQIIDKQVIKICYSYEHKGALAVWYTLDGSLVNTDNIKKRPRFYSEKSLKSQYKSKYKDYTNSGYDRGHLAPDASFDYDKKILRKVYTMANIIPQYPNVNRHQWTKVERLERMYAVKHGIVNIVNLIEYPLTPKKIGKNQVSVPSSGNSVLFLYQLEAQNTLFHSLSSRVM